MLFLLAWISACSSGKPPAETPPPAEVSESCGTLQGDTAADVANLRRFCSAGIVKGAILSARANESLLWLSVPRVLADQIRSDQLSGKELVSIWMRSWKINSGQKIVTVYVKWEDVEVAQGQASAFSGDTVTIR